MELRSLSYAAVASSLLWSWPALSETRGWKGPPVEHKPERLPGFPKTKAGHIAYVKWLIPLVMKRGLSHESALLYAAHSSRETGYGYHSWNFNFGNIKAGDTPQGPWISLKDPQGSRARYRWFETADDGLDDNLRLLREGADGRYKTAWSMLLAGDPQWYGQIGLAGYYEGTPDPKRPGRYLPVTAQNVVAIQRAYDKTVDAVRRYEQSSGDVTSVSAQVSIGTAHWSSWALVLIFVGGAFWVLVDDKYTPYNKQQSAPQKQ